MIPSNRPKWRTKKGELQRRNINVIGPSLHAHAHMIGHAKHTKSKCTTPGGRVV